VTHATTSATSATYLAVDEQLCWKYALEPIIKYYLFSTLLLIFVFYAIIFVVVEYVKAKRLRGKLICTCRVINNKYRFLVLPLGLAQVLHDGSVFLIMGIVKV
jgi:hypothetical protein